MAHKIIAFIIGSNLVGMYVLYKVGNRGHIKLSDIYPNELE